MKKSVFFGLVVAGVMTFGSCGGNKQQAAADDEDTTAQEELVPRDLTVYGIPYCLWYLYQQFWYVNLGDAD